MADFSKGQSGFDLVIVRAVVGLDDSEELLNVFTHVSVVLGDNDGGNFC